MGSHSKSKDLPYSVLASPSMPLKNLHPNHNSINAATPQKELDQDSDSFLSV